MALVPQRRCLIRVVPIEQGCDLTQTQAGTSQRQRRVHAGPLLWLITAVCPLGERSAVSRPMFSQ